MPLGRTGPSPKAPKIGNQGFAAFSTENYHKEMVDLIEAQGLWWTQ